MFAETAGVVIPVLLVIHLMQSLTVPDICNYRRIVYDLIVTDFYCCFDSIIISSRV